MIKFFRKIRQNLLSENKFSKYLLYAIGEIILVVIGILIALTLNNNNEIKKTETKALALFDELLGELASDIKSIKNAGLFYEEKDSLTFLVLNSNLTRKEYQNDLVLYLSLTSATSIIDLSNDAYQKLLQMSDAIPVEYRKIMKELYLLNKKKNYVDLMSNKMSESVEDILKHQFYNYSWAVQFNQQEFIDYLYNDNRYKSDVKFLSSQGVNEHFQHAFYYMQRSIICYKEIATLLNKPIDSSLLGFDSEIAKTLIGNWTSEQVPGLIITAYVENNSLLYKSNTAIKGEFYILSKTKLINSHDKQFYTIVKEGKETMLKLKGGIIWEKTKV